MEENNLVSVIVPAYNHELYVQDTIRSIIAQTYSNVELIVIDDGSKDSTFLKIKELEPECKARFKRVVFITQTNQGVCGTLNNCLGLANGLYVYIIASDDIALPSAIEKEVMFLDANPNYALAVGDNQLFFPDGTTKLFSKVHTPFKKYKKDFGSYRTLICANYIPNGYLIRKSIFEKIGLHPQEVHLDDWWMMLQIAKYAKMKYLGEVLFKYRQHSTNTIKQRARMCELTYKTWLYEIELLKKQNFGYDVQKIINKGCIRRTIGIKNIVHAQSEIVENKIKQQIKIFNIPIWVRLK